MEEKKTFDQCANEFVEKHPKVFTGIVAAVWLAICAGSWTLSTKMIARGVVKELGKKR